MDQRTFIYRRGWGEGFQFGAPSLSQGKGAKGQALSSLLLLAACKEDRKQALMLSSASGHSALFPRWCSSTTLLKNPATWARRWHVGAPDSTPMVLSEH